MQDLKEKKPDEYAKFMAAKATGKHYDPTGAESLQHLCDRMWSAFTDICVKHRGQKVLIVSHGQALHILFSRIILGDKYRPVAGGIPLRFSIVNTALNVVSVPVKEDGHDDPPRLLSLGDLAQEHDPLPTHHTPVAIFGSPMITFAAGFSLGVGAVVLTSFLLRRK